MAIKNEIQLQVFRETKRSCYTRENFIRDIKYSYFSVLKDKKTPQKTKKKQKKTKQNKTKQNKTKKKKENKIQQRKINLGTSASTKKKKKFRKIPSDLNHDYSVVYFHPYSRFLGVISILVLHPHIHIHSVILFVSYSLSFLFFLFLSQFITLPPCNYCCR